MSSSSGTKIRGASLRTKVLVPFLAILLTLGSAATIGTILIITGTLEKTADERLQAFQQQIYTEIRNLETRLVRRTNLLELSFVIDRSFQDADIARLNKIEHLIDENLAAEGMTARYVAPRDVAREPGSNLAELIRIAGTSGKSQVRFTTDIGPDPAMTVVRPIYSGEEIVQYVVIQAVMDSAYLESISRALNLNTALYDLNGTFLVGSIAGHDFQPLTPEILEAALNGQGVFTSQDRLLKHRNLFYAIPLGSTDMLIAQLEMPLADISSIVSTLTMRSTFSILFAMLIGGLIYYRLISQILTPAQRLLQATKAIGEGHLDYRIEDVADDGEFGQLASSFNTMMQNVGDMVQDSLDRERELTRAQEELRYKDILEEKNRAIESTNAELKLHLKEISTLLQLNQAMASTLELDVLFDRVINTLSELLNCNIASLMLYNPGTETLIVRHSLGIDEETLGDVSFTLQEGISGEAARTHKAIYVTDLKKDDRYLNYKGKLPAAGSLLSMPLLSKNRLCGVLNLHHPETDGFSEDSIKLARAVTNQVAVAVENTQLYEQAKRQSITDELTGLANRRHFQTILQREIVQAQRYSSNISMIMADIDNFKRYNDTHGHLQGDIALKKVASILLQNTRGIDMVARFGGEEFVILLPKTTISGARITAEKLREIVAAEEFEGERESQPGGSVTISLGVASYPEHTSNMELLLDMADQALYRAKESGRNQVHIWDGTNDRKSARQSS